MGDSFGMKPQLVPPLGPGASRARECCMAAPDNQDLLVERSEGVLILTLNRPSRKNAMSRAMMAGITAAVNGLASDDEIRVVLLRTSGADFCTGVDLDESNSRDRGGGDRPKTGHLQRGFPHRAHAMVRALDIVQVPVVAAVRGWAAGVGNALALSADVVVADTTAKFWVPMVSRGFTPDSGNTWLLPRLVGLARAKEMILRSRPIDAATAASWGLIAQCVAPDELDGAVQTVVTELRDAATVAVGLAKTLIHRNLEVDFASALQNEGIYEELAVRTDDFKEGIRSFTEKRKPDYKGR
jgi:2-(1,2-epoxy-1,2-dihydrophenyl)acetyl-CoA isomerase